MVPLQTRCDSRRPTCSRCKALGWTCQYSVSTARKGVSQRISDSHNSPQSIQGSGSAPDSPKKRRDSKDHGVQLPPVLEEDRNGGSGGDPKLDDTALPSLSLDGITSGTSPFLDSPFPDDTVFQWDNFNPGLPDDRADFYTSLDLGLGPLVPDVDGQEQGGRPIDASNLDPKPLFSHPPSTVSASNQQQPTHPPDTIGCSCIQVAVSLLDELEIWGATPPEPRSLDSPLSVHREAVTQCQRIQQCHQCRRQSGTMIILNLVLEKLAGLCEGIVASFLRVVQDKATTNHSILPSQEEQGLQFQHLMLGGYHIGGEDGVVLMRALISLHIGKLGSLLNSMKQILSFNKRESQMARLLQSEQRIHHAATRLSQTGDSLTLETYNGLFGLDCLQGP
ncbi:hypothetical protein BDW59DRAFT_159052 [Aspergillus cavernicola]|uniref:Zn(2)-C6 fungal-type domain-containing protein n=1 Tax=Aspergillus cavernicola TaxID=176166 RepID=A0ABR4INY3_9EURO